MRLLCAALISALLLSACANRRTTDIDVEDASQAQKVKFGTVLDSRVVTIRSEESGAIAGGAIAGGFASALIGQTNGATLAGLALGAMAGSGLHRFIENENGIEYTVALADGNTIVIAQLQGSGERVFHSGDAVMVQYGSTVNRVLSAADLPEKVAKPRGVTVAGATGDKLDTKVCDKATMGRSQREVCTQH
ncbi:MAG: outer rane lipoprotein-like [Hyphomicrobiales bacterium]|nr:outer rane lipoprotein-like [Hyphomicrobiales bacterium]